MPGADQLIQNIQTELAQLSEVVNSSPGVTDEDRAQLQSIAESFSQFVSGNLSEAPGQKPEKPQGPATATMETGGATDFKQAF